MTHGDRELAGWMQNIVRDALADPVTAPQMPFSAVIWPSWKNHDEAERGLIKPAAVLLHCCYLLLHMKG
jgi:hypothetical protein